MLAVWGYAASALGYALLLLLLLTSRKSGLAKYLLILATAATCVWSLSPFFIGELTVERLVIFDNIKQFFWLLFLAACLKDNFTSLVGVLKRPETWLILALPIIALVVPLYLDLNDSWLFLIQTLLALQVLILLEVIYRQAGENRWAFKPLILYLGATNLFEFVTFANALMVEQLDLTYIAARGFIYTALIPFLVLAIRRVQHWGVDIFVSREVVLHSSLLVVAGCYLFVMSLIGYVVKYFGGQWSATIQIILIFLSLALLATLFLSASFRTKVKVFITKHFFANQFDYRHEWVKLTQSLENTRPGQTVYQTILNAFLQAMGYQSGLLIKRVDNQVEYLADQEAEPLCAEQLVVIQQFFDFFQQKNWIIDIAELRSKPFVYEGLKVNHATLDKVTFQLVLPIYRGETFWGLVLMTNTKEKPRSLNWELRDYLTAVTAQVTNFLFHHEAAKEVAENAQFAAFTRMSAFVLHDLKNVLAQIDLILCNAEQHKDNPEFIDDTFETLHHTKARMDKMLRQLSEKNAEPASHQSLCCLSQCIESVINQRCATQLPQVELTVSSETDVVLDQDKFANVMYHLISNAQQATADDGFVRVELSHAPQSAQMVVTISDNGSGMSKSFIQQRLFTPFDTTKGNAGMGIGAYDAKAFLEKIGGFLYVQSEENVGTVFTLNIPAD
ncbi:XrtA/PEP-CTERM system histidine kinase PrsK [Paraglaciecola polaris]|uniref:histidine kinase n=1 Tax=Paraglaciecola polaris LMG 21857 TaxID=1129793 RepID=K6ZXR3_9ALTE|nr:XrtA/PEP-CTERM system histidine kinase PrsK [Paraglaciecola polaris]GAC35017.1 sensor histidine kinase [Paraglaciecola polaris LMG 21857]|tara:strand:+ start:37488 stop:39506 length:2019 start_codon:yes stop_codon:yes gene_type:complete